MFMVPERGNWELHNIRKKDTDPSKQWNLFLANLTLIKENHTICIRMYKNSMIGFSEKFSS